MTKYFNMDVREEYPGQVQDYLNGIDPKFHVALVLGVHYLSQDQDEPVRDHYFTAIHATIMQVEDYFQDYIRNYYVPLEEHYTVDWSIVEEKK